MPEPLNIFVSYSRHDKKWLDALQMHLKPLVRGEQVHLWDDTRIKAGARWKEEIKQALEAADIAILLISHYFLASDFILDEELQPLLKTAEEKGLVILPVIVGHSRFQQTKSLSVFQAVNNPDKPLSRLPKWKRNEIFVQLTGHVDEALKHRRAQREDEKAAPEKPPEKAHRLEEAYDTGKHEPEVSGSSEEQAKVASPVVEDESVKEEEAKVEAEAPLEEAVQLPEPVSETSEEQFEPLAAEEPEVEAVEEALATHDIAKEGERAMRVRLINPVEDHPEWSVGDIVRADKGYASRLVETGRARRVRRDERSPVRATVPTGGEIGESAPEASGPSEDQAEVASPMVEEEVGMEEQAAKAVAEAAKAVAEAEEPEAEATATEHEEPEVEAVADAEEPVAVEVEELETEVVKEEGPEAQEAEAERLEEQVVEPLAEDQATLSPPAPSEALPETWQNTLGMQFVLIPAGSFEMGSTEGGGDEKPVHLVTISRPFYLVQFQAIPRAMRFRDTSRSEGGKWRAKSDFRTSLPALHPPLSDAATLRKARSLRDCTEDSLKLH